MATTKTASPRTTAASRSRAAAAPAAAKGAPAAPRARAAKAAAPAAEPAMPAAAAMADAAPGTDSPAMKVKSTALRSRDLVDRIAKITPAKKKVIKEVLDAALVVLGDALHKGEELNLPPLGKAKVSRQKDQSNGEMIIVKIKRSSAKPGAKKSADQGLAGADE